METIYLTVNLVLLKLLHDVSGTSHDLRQWAIWCPIVITFIIFIIVIIPKIPSI